MSLTTLAELEVLVAARDELSATLKKLDLSLDKFSDSADKSAKSAEDKVGKRLKSMADGANKTGKALALALIAPLIGAGTQAARTFGEFESAMATMRAVTKATGAEMKQAAALAEQLGNDIEIPNASAKDAALAMAELGKANFSAKEAMAATKGSLQLAAVAQIDAATAAEIQASNAQYKGGFANFCQQRRNRVRVLGRGVSLGISSR